LGRGGPPLADIDNFPLVVSGLLLAHGAGGGAGQHTLLALEQRLDLPVRRMEFAYRRQGRRWPDRAPKLVAEVRQRAREFARQLGVDIGELALGGRSLGGRMCSMAVAEGLPAAALVLLSYPLHPPKRPDRLRVAHFGEIDVPTLFVSGDRDPFGTPEELAAEIGAIAGPVTVRWLKGQRHEPKAAADDEIAGAVAAFLTTV